MADTELKSEQAIIQRFQEMRQALDTVWSKINDLESEAAEHDLVMKTLEPMDPKRKCFRLVGDVLVERTVAEVLPAVAGHKENIGMLVQQLQGTLAKRKQELADFQTKYKIRVKGKDAEEAKSAEKPGSSQGVLVS